MEENSPQIVSAPTEVSNVTVVKNNSFLITLLSVLLLVAVFIAGFFAYQTQNLVKEITKLQTIPTPTPIATTEPLPTPKPPGYHGYNVEGKRFTLNIGKECTEEIKPFDSINITCSKVDFIITINPQAGGHGMASAPTISKLKLGNYEWEKRLFMENESASYSLTSGEDYYLVEVIYKPYSTKSSDYFNQILSTFKFIEPVSSTSPLPVVCTMEAKVCPDGSSVGRSGPKCEFAPCPTTSPQL